MNRREFIKHIALISAATVVLPEQLLAHERSLELNAIKGVDSGLLVADEVFVAGMAGFSAPAWLDVYTNGLLDCPMGLNLFGGVIRWSANPEHKMRITNADHFEVRIGSQYELIPYKDFCGGVRYIDQDGLYKTADLGRLTRHMEDPIRGRCLVGTLAELTAPRPATELERWARSIPPEPPAPSKWGDR